MKLHYSMIFLLSSLTLFADGSLSGQGSGQELVEERLELESQNLNTSADSTEISYETASADEAADYVAAAKKPPAQKSGYYGKKQPPKQPLPCEYSNRVQVGGNYSYAWIKPKRNKKTKGSLGGAQAIYEYRPQDAIYAAAAFNWRAGTTENHTTKRKIQDYKAEERVGYTFGKKRIGDNRLTFFTGAGLRYLAEKVSVHSASLIIDYTEFYVPLGFLFENKVNSIFSWGCNFEWMPQVFPVVRLQPLSGAQWGLKYKISNFYVEVPLTFTVCSKHRCAIIVSPFFEVWHDGRTTAKTTNGLALDLPSNRYLFTGVNVNFGVSF